MGDRFRERPRTAELVTALDGTRQEIDLLLCGGVDRKIDKPALNLGPFVAQLMRQTVRIFFKGLV